MAYHVELLTTVADCDKLLLDTTRELRDLQVRETVLEAQGDRTEETAATTADDLVAQQAVIDALTPVVATLPAGSKARLASEASLRHATQRRDNLTAGQQTRGPVAALGRALDLRQVQLQVAEVTAFLAEVTARKAAL